MKRDPFTIRVALAKKGEAKGELYLDDGESYDHQQGNFVWRAFEAERKNKVIRVSSTNLATDHLEQAVDGVALSKYYPSNEFAKTIGSVRVEKVVVLGVGTKPTSVKLEGGPALEFEYVSGVPSGGKKEGPAGYVVVKDPKVLIKDDWTILISI
jgi:alpha 1,3-glucosidase